MANTQRMALASIIAAAVLAACVLVPGLELSTTSPWLGALLIVVPTTALLTVGGYRHYGLRRALAVALTVTLAAGGVSWVVAVFTLVKALSGQGFAPVWAVLLFATPAISVLRMGVLALRIVPRPRRE